MKRTRSILFGLWLGLPVVYGQGTAFTYQGLLSDNGGPAHGRYDLTFILYDALTIGSVLGGPLTNPAVSVSNGLFTVRLDFGAGPFEGGPRWLEVGVRTNDSPGAFEALVPRQPMTVTPYAITAANLTGVLASPSLAGTYGSTVYLNNPANQLAGTFNGDGGGLTNLNAATLQGLAPNSFWQLGGNLGTTAGPHFLGTADNQPLELKVNGNRALRLEPTPTNGAVNVVAGSVLNRAAAGVVGATISGGGALDYFGNRFTNEVSGNFGTIGGGGANSAAGDYATVGGGLGNRSANRAATVGGGQGNASTQDFATVGGGLQNTGSGTWATIGGGNDNTSSGLGATVGGGEENASSGAYATVGGGRDNASTAAAATVAGGALNVGSEDSATVGGGQGNMSSGFGATVPGGYLNTAAGRCSLAAGANAKAVHDGAFVWADSMDSDFSSTGTNQFLVRASGGVAINKNNPSSALDVNGTVRATAFAGNGAALTNLNAGSLTAGALPPAQLAGTYSNPVNLNNASNTFAGNGGALVNVNAAMLQGLAPSAFWQLSGNTGSNPGLQFLGTTDNQPLELKVNGTRALRLEPNAAGAPNVIAGAPANAVDAASVGATISGGRQNSVNSSYGTVGGGESQTIGGSASHATIGGGGGNNIQLSSSYATIGGGQNNLIQPNSDHSMVGGGLGNAVNGFYTSILGGQGNTVAARYASIGGGAGNGVLSGAQYASIGGGQFNAVQTNAIWGTIAGGSQNAIGPGALAAAIGGGTRNVVRTNSANATIPGGSDNVAAGNYAFAAGRRAQANHSGAFVWADSNNADFASTNQNSFSVRAVGGFRFVSAVDGSGNPTAGVALESGATAWGTLSDRNAKKNFSPVDTKAVLDKLAAVPVQQWNYRWESDQAVPHLGPTAQDFKHAFYPGREDKHLTTQEVDGVALAAIQGLNQRLKERETEIQGQRRELESQRHEIEALQQAVAELRMLAGHRRAACD